jgi:hypothetical protein
LTAGVIHAVCASVSEAKLKDIGRVFPFPILCVEKFNAEHKGDYTLKIIGDAFSAFYVTAESKSQGTVLFLTQLLLRQFEHETLMQS